MPDLIDGDEFGYSAMRPADVFAELRRLLTSELSRLYRKAAAAWAVCERAGLDMSELLALPLPRLIRQLAHGQIVPGVLDVFGARVTVSAKVAALPLPDQRKVCEAGGLDVAEPDGANGYTTRRIPAKSVQAAHCDLAIGPDGLRSFAEQVAELSRRRLAEQQKPPRPDGVKVDTAAGVVRIGRKSAPIPDVVAAFRKAGEATDAARGPATESVTLKVTPAELARLQAIMGARPGCKSAAAAARAALIQFGII